MSDNGLHSLKLTNERVTSWSPRLRARRRAAGLRLSNAEVSQLVNRSVTLSSPFVLQEAADVTQTGQT